MNARTRNPDRRYRAVITAQTAPEHTYERGLWSILHGVPIDNERLTWALEVFSDVYQREIFQAWLISRATDADIERWLAIPSDVTQIYRHLFFDVFVFRDELDLLSWVREYEAERRGTPYGVQLLRDAVQGGVEKMCWTFGRNQYTVDPERVKQQVMTHSYMRSLAGRGHAATSKEAQAALAQGNAALKAAQVAGKTNAPDAQAFLLKLMYREMTEPVTETVQKEDILH